MTDPCIRCGVPMMPDRRWRALTSEERSSSGQAKHAARGLCNHCYKASRGDLADYERRSRPSVETAEEAARLLDPTRPVASQLAHVAARLGMTPAAVEKALARARAQGWDG